MMTEAEALADVQARIAALEAETACVPCAACRVRRIARAIGGVFAGFLVVALGLMALGMIVERVFTFPPVGMN